MSRAKPASTEDSPGGRSLPMPVATASPAPAASNAAAVTRASTISSQRGRPSVGAAATAGDCSIVSMPPSVLFVGCAAPGRRALPQPEVGVGVGAEPDGGVADGLAGAEPVGSGGSGEALNSGLTQDAPYSGVVTEFSRRSSMNSPTRASDAESTNSWCPQLCREIGDFSPGYGLSIICPTPSTFFR